MIRLGNSMTEYVNSFSKLQFISFKYLLSKSCGINLNIRQIFDNHMKVILKHDFIKT